MKKLFFLTALLCASVAMFADDPVAFCDSAITSVQGRNATVTMRLVSGTIYEFSITTADNIVSWNKDGSNFYANVNGVGGYQVSKYLNQNGNTLSVLITSSSKPSIYANALYIVLDGFGENQFNIPMNSSWETCGAEKTDPKLSLNSEAETLDTDNNPKTFQIVATQDGDGAISYSSSNTGVASVSNTGLVTAQGRGTATITVTSAETKTYALSTKTLTVTVTGKLNWDALDWIIGSNNKYKLDPAEGQSVVSVQHPAFAEEDGIYTTISGTIASCSLPSGKYAIQGGGVVLYLSAFSKKETPVTIVRNEDSKEYNCTVFYADGEDTTTAITNTEVEAKAVKVFENGQLVIIKNGVKYNAIGTQL